MSSPGGSRSSRRDPPPLMGKSRLAQTRSGDWVVARARPARLNNEEVLSLMSPRDRDAWQVFVRLADTLVADFDVMDFLDTLAQASVELLGVTAIGILLADHTGTLYLVAASTQQARVVELSQLQNAEGPCLDAYRTRAAVQCPDLATARDRWQWFVPAALAAGFGAVHALPMRLREQAIGAMSLFSAEPLTLDAQTAELGQALADVATIGILHERAFRRHEVVTQQLQSALNSRIVIEQAKGVLAERLQLSIENAFTVLRAYARDHNLKLADVAAAVTRGELHHDLAAGIPRHHDPMSHESRD